MLYLKEFGTKIGLEVFKKISRYGGYRKRMRGFAYSLGGVLESGLLETYKYPMKRIKLRERDHMRL